MLVKYEVSTSYGSKVIANVKIDNRQADRQAGRQTDGQTDKNKIPRSIDAGGSDITHFDMS